MYPRIGGRRDGASSAHACRASINLAGGPRDELVAHLVRDPTHRAYCDSSDDGIVDSGTGDGVLIGVESIGR